MRDPSKPSWIVRIPTPLWLIGLIVIALLVDWQLELATIVQHRPTGAVLIALGLVIAASGRLAFKKHNAEIFPWSESHGAFVTAGPFRYSRNPMYLGLCVIAVGAAFLAGTWLMWLVPPLLFALDHFVIIPFEERSMERTFGDAYNAYRARVRRWI
jgi:protein-S-isoprenylcysteine O-methyltransferase Ste14